jgi:hypothetical protein
MEFNPKKRNPAKVLAALHEDRQAKWTAKEDLKIIFPKRYLNGKLGSLDDKFNTVGMFAVVLADGSYDVCSVCSIMPLTPDESTVIKLNGVDYFELSFGAGSIVCPNLNLVQRSNLAFEIYDEFISKTRIPPYMDSLDHLKILDTLLDFTGVSLGVNQAITRIYNATTTRNPKDRTQPARELYQKAVDLIMMEVDRIPLRSVAYGADNTTSRLLGSYLPTGLNSALVNPSETVEEVEQVYIS